MPVYAEVGYGDRYRRCETAAFDGCPSRIRIRRRAPFRLFGQKSAGCDAARQSATSNIGDSVRGGLRWEDLSSGRDEVAEVDSKAARAVERAQRPAV